MFKDAMDQFEDQRYIDEMAEKIQRYEEALGLITTVSTREAAIHIAKVYLEGESE